MSENGRKELSLAKLDDLKLELRDWENHGIALRQLIIRFLENEKSFRHSLTGNDQDPNIVLLNDSVRAMISQARAHPEAVLPFFGSNSSGKSTLLNALLGGTYMPASSGHVTARICAIAYAKPGDAKIVLTTLEGLHTGYPLPKSAISIVNWTEDQVREQLAQLLRRPSETMSNAEFTAWTSQVVVLQYPFELLESGMMFVDLPGTSSSDRIEIQQHLENFFKLVRPAGVCFLYGNPTFSDGDIAAYNFLDRALECTKDANVDPEIFFISTKLSFGTVALDYGFFEGNPYDSSVYTELIEQRWKMKKDKHHTNAETYEMDLNFAVVNARDYTSPDLDDIELLGDSASEALEKTREIFGEFRRRLFTFSVLLQRVRYETIYKRLLDGSAQFFRIYNTHKSKNLPMVLEQVAEAKAAAELLETSLISASNTAIDHLPTILQGLYTRDSISKEIWNAADMASASYDGKNVKEMEEEMIKKIREAIAPKVQTLVITPAMDQLETILNGSMERIIRERMDLMNRNVVFGSALRSAIIVDSIQFHSAGPVGTLFHRFLRTLQNTQRGTKLLTIVASPLILTLAAVTAVASFFGNLAARMSKIDENRRKSITNKLLEEMGIKISFNELKRNAAEDIQKLIQDVRANIDTELKTTTHSLQCLERSEDTLKELRTQFATYECECWVELRKLEGSLAPVIYLSEPTPSSSEAVLRAASPPSSSGSRSISPTSNHSSPITIPLALNSPSPDSSRHSDQLLSFRAKNDRCRLIYAQWKGKRVLVKKAPEGAVGDVLLNFLEDAHYSLHIRRLAAESSIPPSIMPALAIHKETRQDGLAEYSLIYDDCEGDVEQLYAEDEKLMRNVTSGVSSLSVINRLYFCLQVATGVASLHHCNMIHRNIRPQSLWYRREGTHFIAYLTDYAMATTSSINNDSLIKNDNGNNWTPPELLPKSNDAFGSRSGSGSSIGSSSSSPASNPPTSSRKRAVTNKWAGFDKRSDIWMLGKTIDFLMTGNGLELKKSSDWKVLKKSIAEDPSQRPTADEIVNQLQIIIRLYFAESSVPVDSPLYQILGCPDRTTGHYRRGSQRPSRPTGLAPSNSYFNATPASVRIQATDHKAKSDGSSSGSSETSSPLATPSLKQEPNFGFKVISSSSSPSIPAATSKSQMQVSASSSTIPVKPNDSKTRKGQSGASTASILNQDAQKTTNSQSKVFYDPFLHE